MPLDASGSIVYGSFSLIEKLSHLGLNPVPLSFVRNYKREIKSKFWNRPSPKWVLSMIPSGYAVGPHLRNLSWIKSENKYSYPNDISGAPEDLIKVAEKVEQNIADVRFGVEWFDKDPILYAITHDEIACLGIWDNGKIIVTAGPRKQPWYRRLFG